MNVAYIRVSTAEQNLDRQRVALEKHDIGKWYEEKVSGKNVTDRTQLKLMMDFVREGDTVYVSDFSRLARSTKDLLAIVETLQNKKVHLISLKESFDTASTTGKLMLTMIGAINEFERQNILERQREGMAIAKVKGKYKGRRPVELENFEEAYKNWESGQLSVSEFARLFHVSRGTIYNRKAEYKQKHTVSEVPRNPID